VTKTKTVVFIHGAWLTPTSWDLFKEPYERRGYVCLAPPWPYNDRTVAALRRNPDPRLARAGIAEIVDHYAEIVEKLPEPPILVGHSFGGLFVQLLLDRGLGAAGVGIDSAPIRGVLAGPRALRSALSVLLTWKGWTKTIEMPFKNFQRDFANTLPEMDQREAYARHVVPAPGRIYFQNACGIASRIGFGNAKRAPLLLVAGLSDRTIEPAMMRATLRKYRKSGQATELKEFPNRPHFLIATPGWEEIADYCIEWAEGKAQPRISISPDRQMATAASTQVESDPFSNLAIASELPFEALVERNIERIDTVFRRLAYLASLRDPDGGMYRHPALNQMAPEEIDAALREVHWRVFYQWLDFTLGQQRAELTEYLGNRQDGDPSLLPQLQGSHAVAHLPPAEAGRPERLFFENSLALVGFLTIKSLVSPPTAKCEAR
jgi:pimeloyl-ACP methyl ester carboxylesterase